MGCEDVPRLFERISGLAPAGLEIKRIAIEFEDRTLSGLTVEVTEDAAGRRKWKAFLQNVSKKTGMCIPRGVNCVLQAVIVA